MKKTRKLFAIVIAMVTMLVMTVVPVSARGDYPYLTTANGTQYTTVVPAGGVSLYVQKLSASYVATPFEEEEIPEVQWSWNTTGSGYFTVVAGSYEDDESYYAMYTVTPSSTTPAGSYSVRASYNGAYIDLTLVVPGDSQNPQDADVDISVYCPGASGFTAEKAGITADPDNYYYATPLKALDAIIGTSYSNGETINSYIQSGGYVSAITGYDSNSNLIPKAANYNTGEGWNYRVFHSNGVLDGSSETIDASSYKLSDGDCVRWYYGTYSQAVAYFNSFITAN